MTRGRFGRSAGRGPGFDSIQSCVRVAAAMMQKPDIAEKINSLELRANGVEDAPTALMSRQLCETGDLSFFMTRVPGRCPALTDVDLSSNRIYDVEPLLELSMAPKLYRSHGNPATWWRLTSRGLSQARFESQPARGHSSQHCLPYESPSFGPAGQSFVDKPPERAGVAGSFDVPRLR